MCVRVIYVCTIITIKSIIYNNSIHIIKRFPFSNNDILIFTYYGYYIITICDETKRANRVMHIEQLNKIEN